MFYLMWTEMLFLLSFFITLLLNHAYKNKSFIIYIIGKIQFPLVDTLTFEGNIFGYGP